MMAGQNFSIVQSLATYAKFYLKFIEKILGKMQRFKKIFLFLSQIVIKWILSMVVQGQRPRFPEKISMFMQSKFWFLRKF